MYLLYYDIGQNQIHEMSDTEFDVLDELYFVQSFKALHGQLKISEDALKETLAELIRQGWVKILQSQDEEISPDEANFDVHYANYYYLATKAGLLAHNSR